MYLSFIYLSIRISLFTNVQTANTRIYDMTVKYSEMYHVISVMRQINNGIIYYYIIMWNEHQLKCIYILLFLSLISAITSLSLTLMMHTLTL